jgi:hypothetical protein
MDYQELIFDPQVIRRFDVNGPRYTSYPTADRFVEAFGADDYVRWLGQTNCGRHRSTFVIIRPHTLLQYDLLLLRLQQDHHQGPRPFRQVHQVLGQGNRDAGSGAGRQSRRGSVALRRRHTDFPFSDDEMQTPDGHHPQAFPFVARRRIFDRSGSAQGRPRQLSSNWRPSASTA